MIRADEYYKRNLHQILTVGVKDENPRPKYKDGTPAHSIFITGVFEKYNLANKEFPISTLRKIPVKMSTNEIKWIYLTPSNKLSDAHKLGIKWWDEFDIGDGTIGQRYGATVKRYDLFNKLVRGLKENPYGRRHIMNLYQYADLEETKGLHPCAYETLWSVRKGKERMYLDMTLVQRSSDFVTANHINKLQYVFLMSVVARECGLELGWFNHFVQNLHIYDRHVDAAKEILNKEPIEGVPPTATLEKYDSKTKTGVFNVSDMSMITPIKSPIELAI